VKVFDLIGPDPVTTGRCRLDDLAARARPPSPVTGRPARRGPVVVAVLVVLALLIAPPLAVTPVMVWWVRRVRRPRQLIRRRDAAVLQALGDVIALSQLAADAGSSPIQIVAVVAKSAPPVVAEPLRAAVTQHQSGRRLADALTEVRNQLGPEASAWIYALVVADRYGVSLQRSLETVATEWRQRRRRHAEIRAKRLPVLLLFPLATCVLPATALVTIVPLVVSALSGLSLSPAP
jgi:pilus assembly protein TadC